MVSWVGFDLDGTLAVYNGWKGPEHIGEPIQPIINLVRKYLSDGVKVKVFTARVSWEEGNGDSLRAAARAMSRIEEWCVTNIGQKLEVTNEKDYWMIALYDDRCKQIDADNKGLILEDQYEKALAVILEQNREIQSLKTEIESLRASRLELTRFA